MATSANPALRRIFEGPAGTVGPAGAALTLSDVIVHTAGLFALAALAARLRG